MKRLGALLTRALIAALLLLAIGANVATADPGDGSPADPGGAQLTSPADPGGAQLESPDDPGGAMP